MSVLENLRNLPKENIQKNLKTFKIRSTGNLFKKYNYMKLELYIQAS